MAFDVARAGRREAASRRIIILGFAYPDAIDIRTALPRGYRHVPVRGTASQTSSAQPRLTPDPGPANEPTAASPLSQSAEDARASVGGET